MALMIKQGVVLENNNGKLQVMVERMEACGSCASKESCGQRQDTIIELYSTEDFQKGDRIILTSDSRDITKFSMYVYVFPVIMMILGAALPQIFFKNTTYDLNLITLFSVILFIVISFIVIKGIDKKIRSENVMRVRKI